MGNCVGTGVGEEVGKMKTTAAVVRTLLVVTDANFTLPEVDSASVTESSLDDSLRAWLELELPAKERVVADSAHMQVVVVFVNDTVVQTSSVAIFSELEESATIRPHVGATTNHGQVCVYEYAGGLPLQTVDNTVPSGQVSLYFLG